MSHDTTQHALDARVDAYAVSIAEYIKFQRHGYLVVRGLVSSGEIEEARQHVDDLTQGRVPEQRQGHITAHGQKFEPPPEHLSPAQKAQHFLRIHMLHRILPLHERFLLHPRVLDVVEALIGPDVLALQTMLFIKPPGSEGQGWHQDSSYIPTLPDTLIGAWIAIDAADEYNGGLWFAQGSQVEPVYPPADGTTGDAILKNIPHVRHHSHTDDQLNDLARIADGHPQVLVIAEPGDVVFFGGHILHRSKRNITPDRFRRSFVSHYCNARSYTPWGAQDVVTHQRDHSIAPALDEATGMTNASHILARGDTHLPFAKPKFGTPCAAILSAHQRRTRGCSEVTRGNAATGFMGVMPAATARDGDGVCCLETKEHCEVAASAYAGPRQT